MASWIRVESMSVLIHFSHQVGIAHQFSCPHTHQQNRAVEYKHCHIIEMGLALLAYASMPLKYWDKVFLAAVYLINRTPTELLSYDTPLHHLLGATPPLFQFSCFLVRQLAQFTSI
jgi:hypothetical protein